MGPTSSQGALQSIAYVPKRAKILRVTESQTGPAVSLFNPEESQQEVLPSKTEKLLQTPILKKECL